LGALEARANCTRRKLSDVNLSKLVAGEILAIRVGGWCPIVGSNSNIEACHSETRRKSAGATKQIRHRNGSLEKFGLALHASTISRSTDNGPITPREPIDRSREMGDNVCIDLARELAKLRRWKSPNLDSSHQILDRVFWHPAAQFDRDPVLLVEV
jgi:hypothetical protein